MTVHVDRLTQDVFAVPGEPTTEADEGGAQPTPERAQDLLRRIERDTRRTRSEGYDD